MKDINQLQIKKLFKELDFYETDYEYKNEVITQSESEFMNSVNEFLDGDPELKQLFDEKLNQRFEDAVNKSIQEEEEIDYDVIDEKPTPSPKIKKLYREIVKLTHPDKVKRKKLNDLYIKATNYYNLIDKVGIYRICNELDIDYELEDEDQSVIDIKISDFKNRITFLESTFTWKWFTTEDEMEKNQILIDYIKLRLQ